MESGINSLLEDFNEDLNVITGARNRKLGSGADSHSHSKGGSITPREVSTHFYGEILFDYIDVYYENLVHYIVRLKKAKGNMMKQYKKRPDKK